jgi:D-glycero-alpha-D-manno-heptose-7-phosphate kinase
MVRHHGRAGASSAATVSVGGAGSGRGALGSRIFAKTIPQSGQDGSSVVACPQLGQITAGLGGTWPNIVAGRVRRFLGLRAAADRIAGLMAERHVVEATAPTRIDLAGGTLDIWPVYLFHPGAVTVNAAIDRRAFCRVETAATGVVIESKDTRARAEGKDVSEVLHGGALSLVAYILRALGIETGIKVVTESRVPAGSGLGGSSALAVAVAAAASRAVGRDLDADGLWPVVRDAEAQSIAVPTGVQDYLAAIHGGVLGIHLEPGRLRVERLQTDPGRVEESLLLVDAGVTRFSGINNWEVFKAQIDGQEGVRAALRDIVSAASRLREALVGHRYEEVAGLVAEEWAARKRLAPGVTTPEIDRIAEIAAEAGGAAKVCGAGGGGMVTVWAPPGRREKAEAAFQHAGFKAVRFRLDLRGLEVENVA